MSKLPWDMQKIGDVFRINTVSVLPNTFPSSLFYHHSLPAWDECGGPVVEPGIAIESNKTALKVPCILVSKLNPRKPRVSVVANIPTDQNHCTSTEFVCMEPATDSVPLSFWRHFFSHKQFSNRLDRIAIGSTNSHKRYSPKELLFFSIKIPTIPEQQNIAQILDTLDTQIRKTEALIAKLEKIKEGLRHDLLTRGIDQNGQLRPTPEQAPELYKESSLGLIPKEWDIRTTGEISRSIVPGRDKPQLSNTGVPWITISDLIENRVTKSMLGLYVDERQIRTLMIRTIPAGSVIMSCVGDFGVTSITECKAIINQQLHCFIVNTSINADWLMYSLRQKKNAIDRSATQTTIKYLNKAGCESIVLPTPSLDEQTSIVSQISSLDRRIEKEKKYSDKLAKTKAGLMDDLLTGHVRVTSLLKDAV